jgi:hypothetical protein
MPVASGDKRSKRGFFFSLQLQSKEVTISIKKHLFIRDNAIAAALPAT